jgi:transposase-like protein
MPKTRPQHPAEFREGAVRLAVTSGKRTSEIAADLGVSIESRRT